MIYYTFKLFLYFYVNIRKKNYNNSNIRISKDTGVYRYLFKKEKH